MFGFLELQTVGPLEHYGGVIHRDRVLCIGNATVDRTFALLGDIRLTTKNPAIARPIAFGGVARNVAENLVRLDMTVALAAAVGEDDAGRAILADCARLGIDTAACVISPDLPTPQYVALLDAHNELVIGASDMRAIEALPAGALLHAHARADLAWTFADCNLSDDVLAGIIRAARPDGHRLALDTVSVAKAPRLPADLAGIDLLFCNLAEGREYLALPDAPPEQIAQALHTRGAHTAVVTLGKAGALVARAAGVTMLAALPATVADATGAGDALIAGTLYGAVHGLELDAAVSTGMANAALALESTMPVNPALSPSVLAEREA